MRKSDTLRDLKLEAGEKVGLAPHEFVLKRNNTTKEFKNLNYTLTQLGLTSGAILKVTKGSQHQDGVYELNIHQVSLLNNQQDDI